MKIISNNVQATELFKTARNSEPVMDLKEIEEIINNGYYKPHRVQRFSNSMKVLMLGALIVLPLVAYLALKPAQENQVARNQMAVNVPADNSGNTVEAIPVQKVLNKL